MIIILIRVGTAELSCRVVLFASLLLVSRLILARNSFLLLYFSLTRTVSIIIGLLKIYLSASFA